MSKITWQSPSNIALIKYWGKKENQLPMNPSISLTLQEAKTITELEWERLDNDALEAHFLFENKPVPEFKHRIVKYIHAISEYIPKLKGIRLTINSRNTFPHSSGIASSASSMSALALCLVSLEEQLEGMPFTHEAFYQKASILARLGSGSASRSVYGGINLWGITPSVAASSDFYAVPISQQCHPVFKSYRDAILMVSTHPKKVSSSVGHQLMHQHPFSTARFETAKKNTELMLDILQTGEQYDFAMLTEKEALMLHALMMTSNPHYILMEAPTLEIIHQIQHFRDETGIPVCFTLDAGANVHLLYPGQQAEKVQPWIQEELVSLCSNKMWMNDQVGEGPKQLNK